MHAGRLAKLQLWLVQVWSGLFQLFCHLWLKSVVDLNRKHCWKIPVSRWVDLDFTAQEKSPPNLVNLSARGALHWEIFGITKKKIPPSEGCVSWFMLMLLLLSRYVKSLFENMDRRPFNSDFRTLSTLLTLLFLGSILKRIWNICLLKFFMDLKIRYIPNTKIINHKCFFRLGNHNGLISEASSRLRSRRNYSSSMICKGCRAPSSDF